MTPAQMDEHLRKQFPDDIDSFMLDGASVLLVYLKPYANVTLPKLVSLCQIFRTDAISVRAAPHLIIDIDLAEVIRQQGLK